MHEQRPRISAILTAYNSAAFLGRAIESVLAQRRPVDELIVVDDGSTDGTAQVAKRYAGRGLRYVYQPNQGAGAARNRGLRESTGDLIAYLDADDLWEPDKIERQERYLADHPAVAMVSGHKWWWDVRDDRRWLKRYGGSDALEREILIHNVVGNPSMVLIRRTILARVGPFDPALRWGQDWELWIRIARQAPIGFIDHPVIIYRWHPGNLSHQRKWQRLACFFSISRRAIATHRPAWQRPVLLARAWSNFQFHRARHAQKHGFPLHQQLACALGALASYPLEAPAEKGKVLARVLLGEQLYQRLRTNGVTATWKQTNQ